MVSLALGKLSFSHVIVLRLFSVIGSAAIFGMLAAPVTGSAYWPSAFALAFAYFFFFVGGAGYRILVAVALLDPSRWTPASWSEVTLASALPVLAAAILIWGQDGHANLVLAAYAVAINAAYVPAKFACIEAGCCHAQHRDPFLIRDHDLRHVEIMAGFAAFVAALSAMWAGAVAAAAILGIGGHLAIRLLSGWSRNRLPGSDPENETRGQELLPLALMLAAAIWIAASP